MGRRRHGPVPDTAQAKLYRDEIEPNLAPGNMLMFAHGFNIRFGAITPRPDVDVAMVAPKSPGHRVRELFVEGAGTPALFADPPGRDRAGARARRCRTRKGIGVDARRRHRDDVRGRDRDGSVRRAGGAVRRRQRAGQGRVRDAGRRRLSAGDRVLRVPARAEADRRPDLPGRPELHALLGQRHRRARRLHRRPAHRHRRDAARDEADARRDPERHYAEGWIAENEAGRPWFNKMREAERNQLDRAGRRPAAEADAVPQAGRDRHRGSI